MATAKRDIFKRTDGRLRTVVAGFLMAMVILPFLAPPIQAAVLFSESFDGNTAGELKGGIFAPVTGTKMGWQAELFAGGARGYIKFPVRQGVHYSTQAGTLEFWLKNDRKGGKPYQGEDIYYNTVLEWIGPDFFLPVYFLPKSDRGPTESALVFWGSKYMPAANPYGFYNHLGRKVGLGEWLHVAFTWGPDPQDNALYINGDPFPLPIPVDERVNYGKYLAGAHTLVVGADLMDASEKDGIYHLANSIIDDLRIHDEVITDFDLSRINPKIISVKHDAFSVAGYSGKLVVGDTYTVTLKAEPGGTATFDLGPVQGHIMTEDPDNPGTYVGIHSVDYDENVEDGRIIGHFVSGAGAEADPVAAARNVTVDARIYMAVNPSNDLIPADEEARSGITIVATDANGKAVKSHPLELTMSTTDEYTGIVGGGTFEDMVGGVIEVDWRGVTDSFGEVTAQFISGFAAKTIMISAKDMVTGDVGVGYVRSYIEGTLDVLVKRPAARALAVAGSMEVSLSRDWLTADGRSRSRITAVVKDLDGNPLEGDQIAFTLMGDNGQIRVIQSRTDSRGRATADYIAGIVIGQVQIEVRDMTSGLVALASIELRSDAPAEIALTAEPAEIFVGDTKGSVITAKVTDANGNPNSNTDVLYEVIAGGGRMSADSAVTDEKEGIAEASFLPGGEPGVSTIKATVMSRHATTDELAAAEGAVFLYGLDEEPVRLVVLEWLVKPEDEVVEGQDLVILEDRAGTIYTVKAPREGIMSVFTAEERDRVEYGQTLGYVLPLPE
jgi:biotin carboxyl carrier protein